ncbi:MAG: YbaK/EbsC family protein [Candidatus Nanohaloarchaea archaeon]|nr:YbaK/EbsC family protein [Candidatus Nanohaloarchaea archaeon]
MVDRLRRFLEESVIDGEIIELEQNTKSAKQAAQALGTDKDSIIKSLVFLVDDEPYLVVVPGPARVDEDKLCEALEAEEARIASPEEVEEFTGYEVGGVPPVSLPLPKVIDEAVVGKQEVYGGGGSGNHVLRIDPRFIVDEDSVTADVTE